MPSVMGDGPNERAEVDPEVIPHQVIQSLRSVILSHANKQQRHQKRNNESVPLPNELDDNSIVASEEALELKEESHMTHEQALELKEESKEAMSMGHQSGAYVVAPVCKSAPIWLVVLSVAVPCVVVSFTAALA